MARWDRGLSLLVLVASGLMAPAPAGAQDDPPETRQEILRRQREHKARDLEPYVVSNAEARVLALEDMHVPANVFERGWNRIRPLIGGMPSGSGLVGGVSYLNDLHREAFEFELAARVSTRLFTSFDGEIRFPAARSPASLQARVGARATDYRGLRFFGLGADTRSRDRTTYHLEERGVDLGVEGEFGRVRFGVDGGWLQAEATEGLVGTSLEERFEPSAIPGFATSTTFFHYGASAALDLRDDIAPGAGVVLRGEIGRYDDLDLSRFDFWRVAGEVQGHIPLGVRSRMLALRARVTRSSPADGAAVPFYLMDTIGGGSTLRGFREYRFRDTHTVLLSAEYRWELWAYLDAAIFVDGGTVFGDAPRLDVHDLETAVGFGFRAHGPAGTVLRFDLARSREAIKVHIGGGPSF